MLLMGLITSIAFVVFILKLPTPVRDKLLGFDLLVDIAATIAMMLAFAGSYSGMAAAVFGGLIFSAILIVLKKFLGYDHAMWHNRKLHFVHVNGWFSPRQQGARA